MCQIETFVIANSSRKMRLKQNCSTISQDNVLYTLTLSRQTFKPWIVFHNRPVLMKLCSPKTDHRERKCIFVTKQTLLIRLPTHVAITQLSNVKRSIITGHIKQKSRKIVQISCQLSWNLDRQTSTSHQQKGLVSEISSV